MNKNQIITELYNTQFVDKYCRQIFKNTNEINIEDVVQHCWLQICEIDEKKLINIYNKKQIDGVRQFVSGIINRQCNSVRSSLYYTYVKKNVKNIMIHRLNNNEKWDEANLWEDN
ncbi:MAG: hypothetical protein J6V33_03055 [Bacteroidales bacterium]|nr:hypothetical protein [Bacteroidales bacterium]